MKQEMENRDEVQANAEEHQAEERMATDASADRAESHEAAQVQEETGASELEALKAAAEENYQRYLRTQADFDNFRRRSRAEREEFAKYASQQLIEGLLPIMDNFDRAVAASREQSDFDSLAKGVEMIQRQLSQLLESEGLQPIVAVGAPFNPEFHQAIMQVADENAESGTVVEELQKGYMLKEKVIRPSMVKVAE